MKAYRIFFLACMLSASHSVVAQTSLDPKEYEAVFARIDRLLEADGGVFWKQRMNGPLFFVDPATRQIIANRNNLAGSFTQISNVYIATLPADKNIANSAINWDGERWTMVMLPLPESTFEQDVLILHELFHGRQKDLGFGALAEADNAHLDSYEGRVLLRLELEALKRAFAAEDIAAMKWDLTNAFTFRLQRHKDSTIREAENLLELNEGLAEFTGLMLSREDPSLQVERLVRNIDNFFGNETYVRSFAYQTLPAYGYLLSRMRKNWQHQVDASTDLTEFLIRSFGLEVPTSVDLEKVARSADYKYEIILQQEKAREEAQQLRLAHYRKLFAEDPALSIPFYKMNISFDPRNIVPLEGLGTVYPNLRITDEWGILTVEKHALVREDWSGVVLTPPLEEKGSLISGDGWKLELQPGWMVSGVEGGGLVRRIE